MITFIFHKSKLWICVIFLITLLDANGQNYNQTKKYHLELSKKEIELSTVRLHIFTTEKVNKTIEIKYNEVPVNVLAKICPSKAKTKYKFIVHGFAETWNMTNRWNWVDKMISEMLSSNEASKLCVIALDWKELANGGSAIFSNYWKAISNMKISGDLVTEFLKVNHVEADQLHCIGFSLGAHACSIFAKIYYHKFQVKLGRVTGLDPAGPFYEDKPLEEKLNSDDAKFVDIIHTSEKFGLATNLGHMDFYQDHGASQVEACDNLKDRATNLNNVILYEEQNDKNEKYVDEYYDNKDKINFKSLTSIKSHAKGLWNKIKNIFSKKPKRIFLAAHQFFGCSHLMAVRYFIYSINKCEFEAKSCSSQVHFDQNTCSINIGLKPSRMGYYADLSDEAFKKSKGKFYLHTHKTAPYCQDPI